ncbi:NADH dehydrogenase [Desulfuribacillus alkaliarsenatis]|uniref:NADH dehydrogenase n=1 Tax=Desulfuribacillus alkaliarsenatis TaxID=766136 RepID=A0A1E5G6D5_9FIRM|nr:NADH-quinone oxidoreductase subunit NuoF [Desulfuribacillus alkaliarsenatis]OEF98723.1 NADH dehydrogenase [Desulfuribacillus alkaliarsenatis]
MAHEKQRILICGGTGCISTGASNLLESFKSTLKAKNMDCEYDVILTGCHGFCEQGPIVIIEKDNTLYCQVTIDDIDELVSQHLAANQLVERLLYINPIDNRRISSHKDINFYKKQHRILLDLCGKIDPENISEYINHGGYAALQACFEQKPTDIIEEIKVSKLRGRGGGGFPAGLKWEYTRNADGDPKYIICNADEGDPGAFMDRSIIEGNPHSVLEGMLIAGYAIGSNIGYIYVRAEYPLAVKRLRIAIDQAEATGYLGENILGSNFSFQIKIKEGAGAFVCGESSALMHSIEGHRGMPRSRPPNSTKKGLWSKPTCLNNVETFANIPLIILMGGNEFAKIGTENSTGTKVLALTGKINNTGLAEVPMGISLRDVIFDIGGGIKDGKKLKAVQIGGPSGGCIPEEMLDLPIDFDSLYKAGAMMGSGGLVVLDESTCMVDLAKFFLEFTHNESCGKCTPCREGTYRMLQILEKITDGLGTQDDIIHLERLSNNIMNSSLCGLGKSAPNPIVSTLRYFRYEYDAHIEDKTCPSGVCKKLISYRIDSMNCKACTICLKHCPSQAIIGERGKPHLIVSENCTRCGICLEKCPFQAVKMG